MLGRLEEHTATCNLPQTAYNARLGVNHWDGFCLGPPNRRQKLSLLTPFHFFYISFSTSLLSVRFKLQNVA